jgi:hypothetical protein
MRALLAGVLLSLAACTFVVDDQGEQKLPSGGGTIETGPTSTACFVGGCSSQLCSDIQGLASDCDWKEAYACYRNATCERQVDGACGWTQTAQLQDCLKRAR